ncbi:MAG TPA: CofH family radical SAM protein [Candidatus Thermoplasmatota archaeon]|nr:CofH family radical SAM protein [Candidatus Thermoplasmatota archaeon]
MLVEPLPPAYKPSSREEVDAVLARARRGERLSFDDAVVLLKAKDLAPIGLAADEIRRKKHGDKVYFRNDLNLNHTNVCAADCGFCAFKRKGTEVDAYTFDRDQVREKARAARLSGIDEFHVVGGLHPDLGPEYFEDIFRIMKEEHPRAYIQGLTGVEIDFICKKFKIDPEPLLVRLKAAGLDSLPGGGAEVFHPAARKRMMATKITAERFLGIHEAAHRIGMPTNVSILFGHVETPEEIADHLMKCRDMQDKTGGFHAFVNLAYNADNNELQHRYGLKGPTGTQILKQVAVSRLVLDNFPHIKIPWVTTGKQVAQISLAFGADDIGGSAFEERILEAAGGKTWAMTSFSVTQQVGVPSVVQKANRTVHIVQTSNLENLIRDGGYEPVRAAGCYEPIVLYPEEPQ